jgi:hypothetical protein
MGQETVRLLGEGVIYRTKSQGVFKNAPQNQVSKKWVGGSWKNMDLQWAKLVSEGEAT